MILRPKHTDPPHTVAMSTGICSMLPPTTKIVCVDIDSSAVERVVEQQPLQSIGMITDVEPFLRELADCLTGSKVSQ